MSNAPKNVLVIGATGHFGQQLMPALRQRGHRVHALIRPETMKSDDPTKQALIAGMTRHGVVIHEGALGDHEACVKACRAADIVISAVDPTAFEGQVALLSAMTEAGTVKRFLPSEFGTDTLAAEPGRVAVVDWKRIQQGAVKASGIPYTMVYANAFATYWAGSLGQLGLFAPPTEGSISVFGEGTTKAWINTPEDIARVVALACTDPRCENAEVNIGPDGNLINQRELIAHWENRTGASLARRVVTPDVCDALIADAAGRPDSI